MAGAGQDDDNAHGAGASFARHSRLSTSDFPTATSDFPTAPSPAASSLATGSGSSYLVNTLDDIVDPDDGRLSLREAVERANDSPGADRIRFDGGLSGGTIELVDGPLEVTDDLVIDGDFRDGGADSIIIDGGVEIGSREGGPLFRAENVALRLEDLTVQNGGFAGIVATDSHVETERVAVTGSFSGGPAFSILVDGGELEVADSVLSDTFADGAVGIELRNGAVVTVEDSRITGHDGDNFAAGIVGTGHVTLVDSTVAGIRGVEPSAFGVNVTGSLVIDGSTISDVRVSFAPVGTAVRIDSDLAMTNSTIAEISGEVGGSGSTDAALEITDGSQATVVNTTLTGVFADDIFSPLVELRPGISIGDNATLDLRNSIVDSSIIGPGQLISNGANTFQDAVVAGAVADDRLGVRAEDVFADTVEIDGSGVRAGVLSDNGGPTETVALLDDPANPALDAADPADAPLVDQRGIPRDGTPDIGAFEVGPPSPFVVTTLEDVVDPADGELSLREAVTIANTLVRPDVITFAEAIRGGTILLEGDSPLFGGDSIVITDELVIDGDPDDGGAGGIIIDGQGDWLAEEGVGPFRVEGVEARFEDLTIQEAHFSAIRGVDAAIEVDRVDILGTEGFRAVDITLDGSSLNLRDSRLLDGFSPDSISAITLRNGAEATVIGSEIGGHNGEFADAIFSFDEAKVRIVDSTILNFTGSDLASGVSASGQLHIENSTIERSGAQQDIDAYGVRFQGGEMVIVNSTLAGNSTGTRGAAIRVDPDAAAWIVNSTITGSEIRSTSTDEPVVPGPAIDGRPGSRVHLANSIIDGEVIGTINSNGANTFQDSVVDGAVAGDRLGVRAEEIFADTFEIGDSGVRAGVLADNGGPTQTVALLDEPANPALDAADPADAPAIDQRGFARDANPDIGAFELGVRPLPPLAERVPLGNEDILGVDREQFVLGAAEDAAIIFVDEVGAFQNSLGVYLIGADGEIISPQWAFERIEHAFPDEAASDFVRPGGGPLVPGDTVMLSDLFDPAELEAGSEFGLFLVDGGAERNPFVVFDGGTLAFRNDGGPATITDETPTLVHIDETGRERVVEGNILHSVDGGSPNPLSNILNPGNTGQVTSGLLDGEHVVAFERIPLTRASDRDFNDALFAIDLLDDDNLDGLLAASATQEPAVPQAASATLDGAATAQALALDSLVEETQAV